MRRTRSPEEPAKTLPPPRRPRLQGVSRHPGLPDRRSGLSLRAHGTTIPHHRRSARREGLAALFLRGQGKLESRGLITADGLQPLRVRGRARQQRTARDRGVRLGSRHRDAARPEDRRRSSLPTFDPLALMWQSYFTPPVDAVQDVHRRHDAARRPLHAHARGGRNDRVAARRDRHRALAPQERRRQDRRLRLARAVAALHPGEDARDDQLPSTSGHARGTARLDSRRRSARRSNERRERPKAPPPGERAQRRSADQSLRANQIAGSPRRSPTSAARAPADSLLHHFFRRHPAIGQHDRAFIADGVFAYLRRRRSLEELAQTDAARAQLALAVLVRELGHQRARPGPASIEADDARVGARIQVAPRTTPCRRRSPPTCRTGCGSGSAPRTATPSAPRSRARGCRRRRSTCASIR